MHAGEYPHTHTSRRVDEGKAATLAKTGWNQTQPFIAAGRRKWRRRVNYTDRLLLLLYMDMVTCSLLWRVPFTHGTTHIRREVELALACRRYSVLVAVPIVLLEPATYRLVVFFLEDDGPP